MSEKIVFVTLPKYLDIGLLQKSHDEVTWPTDPRYTDPICVISSGHPNRFNFETCSGDKFKATNSDCMRKFIDYEKV